MKSFSAPEDLLLSKHNIKVFEPSREILQTSSVVVEDENNRSVGYGVLVSEEGFVFTKASMLEDLGDYSVRVDKKVIDCKVDKTDVKWDLAILKFDLSHSGVPVKFASSLPQIGELITCNGVTSLLKRRAKFGVISANQREIPAKVSALDFYASFEEESGWSVEELFEDGKSEAAGLLVGDRILAVEGVSTDDDSKSLFDYFINKWPGDTANILIQRGEEKLELSIPYQWRHELFPKAIDRNEAMSGRISGRRTGFPQVIQHDIVLSQRSMGGPVLNLEGECVGMNIARFSRAETYAIPATVMLEILNSL